MQEARFLYLVKNLRGILYYSEQREQELDWLKRKLRYREVAISETLPMPSKWRKLVVLPKIEDDPVIDTLLNANRYIVPLILLGTSALKSLKKGIVAELKTKQKFSDRELKFNLRLVNYAITDFYVKSIELAEKQRLREREKLARTDLKRFWRIQQDPRGSTFVGYVEPLRFEPLEKRLLSLIPFLVMDSRFLE